MSIQFSNFGEELETWPDYVALVSLVLTEQNQAGLRFIAICLCLPSAEITAQPTVFKIIMNCEFRKLGYTEQYKKIQLPKPNKYKASIIQYTLDKYYV